MDLSRYVLTDRQWRAVEPICPGSLSATGRTGRDTRFFLEAVLWIVRTDAPWRMLMNQCERLRFRIRRETCRTTP
ncbi:transposase [Yoonia sp. R2331]|uniref:transposase n=1 Tax=Yoonia sp. R2331 TaxID=3237238 RepID=UPI0034E4F394